MTFMLLEYVPSAILQPEEVSMYYIHVAKHMSISAILSQRKSLCMTFIKIILLDIYSFPYLILVQHGVEDIQQQVQGACFDTEYAGK